MTYTEKKPRNIWIEVVASLLVLALLFCGVRVAFTRYYQAAYPTHFEQQVIAQAHKNELPPALVYAVIYTESGFNERAESHVDARGLMQITEETFQWAQDRAREEPQLEFDELFDSDVNIRYGTIILRLLLDEFGTYENALCAYHAGWGTTKQWLSNPALAPDGKTIETIPTPITAGYVDKVMQTMETYERLYDF